MGVMTDPWISSEPVVRIARLTLERGKMTGNGLLGSLSSISYYR